MAWASVSCSLQRLHPMTWPQTGLVRWQSSQSERLIYRNSHDFLQRQGSLTAPFSSALYAVVYSLWAHLICLRTAAMSCGHSIDVLIHVHTRVTPDPCKSCAPHKILCNDTRNKVTL